MNNLTYTYHSKYRLNWNYFCLTVESVVYGSTTSYHSLNLIP